MGSEQSQISGLELEEKAVEVTDFWTHHSAAVNSGNFTNLSVFIGEPLVGGSLWMSQTPLEKASKNLMLHRHPCILKYVSSWNKGSKFFLAVEDVKPLSHVIAAQNTLQICIGLHSVLKALCFLHEKAKASHNNVCAASIYVSRDGNWKLGGFEYLCKLQEVTVDYLNKTKVHRYNKGVDPNEEVHLKSGRCDFIDSYAFSVLVLEIFSKKRADDDLVSLSDFKEFCRDSLQNADVGSRPKLSALLEHPFFNHEFIKTYSFLTELPLKSDQEKADFFLNLCATLRVFDELTVGSLLGGLLLSRMVLLNKTAQEELVPYLLSPRIDADILQQGEGLFSCENFQTFLVPKLLEIFCVRDAQIRLLLLQHFANFAKCFTKEQLQMHILPELLVAIKDTNDHLVSVTLRTLAELVPILGASVVIGGKRAKLFNDGRPLAHQARPRSRKNSRRSQELALNLNDAHSEETLHPTTLTLPLPERPSPDGEEGESTTQEEAEQSADELENWEDWDMNEEHDGFPSRNPLNNGSTNNLLVLEPPLEPEIAFTEPEVSVINGNKKTLPDILELDIKSQNRRSNDDEEFNFFQDMEPVIETANVYLIDISDKKNGSSEALLDLSIKEAERHHMDGWGDDSDWD